MLQLHLYPLLNDLACIASGYSVKEIALNNSAWNQVIDHVNSLCGPLRFYELCTQMSEDHLYGRGAEQILQRGCWILKVLWSGADFTARMLDIKGIVEGSRFCRSKRKTHGLGRRLLWKPFGPERGRICRGQSKANSRLITTLCLQYNESWYDQARGELGTYHSLVPNYQTPRSIMSARSGDQNNLTFKTSSHVNCPIPRISQMSWRLDVGCIWDTMDCRTGSTKNTGPDHWRVWHFYQRS